MRGFTVSTRWTLWIGAAFLCVCIAGCGGGSDLPELGTVSGAVTVEGKPAPNVLVQFSPVEGGRTSTAVTDTSGQYELMYTADAKGAQVGKHKVTLAANTAAPSDDQLDLSAPQDVIPAKYQGQTLEYEVKPGSNTIDIKLE